MYEVKATHFVRLLMRAARSRELGILYLAFFGRALYVSCSASKFMYVPTFVPLFTIPRKWRCPQVFLLHTIHSYVLHCCCRFCLGTSNSCTVSPPAESRSPVQRKSHSTVHRRYLRPDSGGSQRKNTSTEKGRHRKRN